MCPIHKNRDRTEVNNYGPISVLSALSKILERILNNCLKNYLTKFGILSKNQYGFKSRVSTEDAVSSFIEEVFAKLDSGYKC